MSNAQENPLLESLAAGIGRHARPVLANLPQAELRYLARRADLQQRYADPARGRERLAWEMSAVARGEQALAEIEACMPPNWTPTRALDVGCGDGGFLAAIARRGVSAYGLNLSEGNIAGAQLRAAAWQQRFHLAVGSATSLPYRAATFDLATCGDVLEHVREPGKALGEIARVLRPGAILWVASPTRFFWRNLLRDPHYGYAGVALLSRRAAAWYLARIRRALPSPGHYEVERLPTYGGTLRALRDIGFEILWGEYRPLIALRDPEIIQSRWKKRLLKTLRHLGLSGPMSLAFRWLAELRCPIRLVCRKR